VFAIAPPPLRERDEGLPLLVRHYLRRFSRESGRQVQEVAPEAPGRVRAYAWPGNIRGVSTKADRAPSRARFVSGGGGFVSRDVK
jgi:two-component system nitrogen regulation response regulator GlnG